MARRLRQFRDLRFERIPREIVASLQDITRRVRKVVFLRGLCAVLAVLLGAFLTIMTIDALVVIFSQPVRWALSLSAYGLVILTALWFLVRPMSHRRTLGRIARSIEQQHPEFEERVSSAVELLTSDDAPELRGSDVLIAAVARSAVEDVQRLLPKREVTFRKARPFLVAAAVVICLGAAVFAAWPRKSSLLVLRASAPFLNLPNISGDAMIVRPGDIVVPRGEVLEIAMDIDSPAVHSATLHAATAGGVKTELPMSFVRPESGGPSRFSVRCAPAIESFRYRIRAGDGVSRFFNVTVVPRPDVQRLDITYRYPAYSGQGEKTDSQASGDIRALEGTDVKIKATLNKPVASAKLRLAGKPEPVASGQAVGGSAYDFAFAADPQVTGTWWLELTDEHGFACEPVQHSLQVVRDQAPLVRIERPAERKLRLSPSDTIDVLYSIQDDFGLTNGELLMQVDRRPVEHVPLPPTAGAKSVRETLPLRLSALDLTQAQRMTLQIAARDNLPEDRKGPQQGLSAVCVIEFDVKEALYDVQVVVSDEKRIQDALETIRKQLVTSSVESEALVKTLTAAKKLTADDLQRVAALRKLLPPVHAAALELADKIAAGAFSGVAIRLRGIDERNISPAVKGAELILLSDGADKQLVEAKEVDARILSAIADLDKLLAELKNVSLALQQAVKVKHLADRQSDLARAKLQAEHAEAVSQEPQPADENAAHKAAQQALLKDLADDVRARPEIRQAALLQARSQAMELAAEAKAAAETHKALSEAANRLRRLQEIDQALRDIAGKQAELAKAALLEAVTTAAAEPMAEASRRIASAELPAAVKQQKSAEKSLADSAAGEKQKQQSMDLAAKAKSMAAETARGAKAVEAAGGAYEAAKQAEAKAGQQASQAAKDVAPLKAPLAGELAKLQQRQDALAQQAAALEAKVKINPLAQTAAKTEASPVMKDASAKISAGNLLAAASSAQQGQQLTERLATQLAADKATADAAKPALDAQAAKAAQDAAAAQQASGAASQAADQAQQAAKAAQQEAQALAAAAKPADASAAAAQAQQTAAKSAAAKTAQQQAEAAQQKAKQAEQAAADAQKKLAALQNQLAAQPNQAAAIPPLAEEARKIAEEQKKLTEDVAALSGAAGKQLAQAAAKQAQAQADQQAQATAMQNAQQAVKNESAAMAQQQKQLAEMAKAAPAAAPPSQKAMQDASPAAAMQQAEQAMQTGSPAAAAPAAQQAAQAAQKMAEAMAAAAQQANPTAEPNPAQQAALADKLTADQAQLRQQVEKLGDEREKLLAEQRQQQRRQLIEQQKDLAKEAQDLAQQLQPVAPELNAPAAAAAAQQAAQALEAAQTDAAAAAANQAGQQLDQMAGALAARIAEPYSPQAGQPAPPQAGQPASLQAAQPSSPQSGQPQSPQGGQPQSPQAGQPSSPQAGQPSSPQSSQQANQQSPDEASGDNSPPSPSSPGNMPRDSRTVPTSWDGVAPSSGGQAPDGPPTKKGVQKPGAPLPPALPSDIDPTGPMGHGPPVPQKPMEPYTGDKTPPPAPPTPLWEKSAELAQQQQALAEQMKALAKDEPAESLKKQQEQLAQTEQNLSDQAQALASKAKQLKPEDQQAAQEMDQAQRMVAAAQQASQEAVAKSAHVSFRPIPNQEPLISKGNNEGGQAPGKPGGVDSGRPVKGSEGSQTGTPLPGGSEEKSEGEGAGGGASGSGSPSNKPSGGQPKGGTPSGQSPGSPGGQPSPAGQAPSSGQPSPSGGQPPAGQSPSSGPPSPSGQPGQSPGAPGSGTGPAGLAVLPLTASAPIPPTVPASHAQAAQSLQDAAKLLSDVAARLPDAGAATPDMPKPSPLAAEMADGVGAAAQAAQSSDGTSAAAAAGALQAAAATAAAQAGAAGGSPSAVAGSSASGASGSGTGERPIDLVELKLKMLDITLDDWARLPPEVRSGILQGSDQLRPEEYRELIKKYFLKIARHNPETPPKK